MIFFEEHCEAKYREQDWKIESYNSTNWQLFYYNNKGNTY